VLALIQVRASQFLTFCNQIRYVVRSKIYQRIHRCWSDPTGFKFQISKPLRVRCCRRSIHSVTWGIEDSDRCVEQDMLALGLWHMLCSKEDLTSSGILDFEFRGNETARQRPTPSVRLGLYVRESQVRRSVQHRGARACETCKAYCDGSIGQKHSLNRVFRLSVSSNKST
jgi:hypothetical protein